MLHIQWQNTIIFHWCRVCLDLNKGAESPFPVTACPAGPWSLYSSERRPVTCNDQPALTTQSQPHTHSALVHTKGDLCRGCFGDILPRSDVTMNSGREWRENVVLCAQTVKMAASTVTAQSSTGSGAAIHTVGFGLSLLNTVHPVSPSWCASTPPLRLSRKSCWEDQGLSQPPQPWPFSRPAASYLSSLSGPQTFESFPLSFFTNVTF